MRALKKKRNHIGNFTLVLMVFLSVTGMVWSQNHDLVINPAPDVTSLSSSDWKSPDIKIGADFGSTSSPDIIQRGVPNQLYARFRINGIQDHTIPSGDIQVKFYYREATVGIAPPSLDDPTWHYIGRLLVTYNTSDGPFAITRVWPTDFPSVTDKAVTWLAPNSGDKFHIAAELVYPTGITDDNPGDNIAVSLYESQSGLLDIVLLHDVSGSMGYYSYGGFSYLEQAKSKAAMFLASMPENHRISFVAFSGNYSGGYEDIWPTSPPMLQMATDPHKADAITATAALTAQGMTPLGQGLERAIQILTTPMDPDRKRVILVLSDGYENYGTPLACAGADSANPCLGGTLLTQLQTNDIKVFTIALGTAADTQCLECLATQTGGQWYASPTASLTLAKVLLDVQQAASSDDLYRSDLGVSGGGDDSYTIYFEGKDNSLYFILSWDDLDADLKLVLRAPGSRRVRMNTETFEGKGYYVVKVKNPKKGVWKYSVSGNEGKNYLAAVRSDKVAVRLGIDTFAEGIAGTPIEIHARIMDGKKPVNNAQVTATIQVPVGSSMETLLQEASQKYIQETKHLPGSYIMQSKQPDISPRGILIKKINGDRDESPVKTRTVTIRMQHTEKGHYIGILKNRYTSIAGEYNISVTCSGRTFQRNFTKQIRIQPAEIDFRKTHAQLVRVKSPVLRETKPTWVLRVYAKDRFGNAVTTPTLLERVKVEVAGARMAAPTISLGTFQQKLNIFPSQRPALEKVKIDGRIIKFKHLE